MRIVNYGILLKLCILFIIEKKQANTADIISVNCNLGSLFFRSFNLDDWFFCRVTMRNAF